MVFKRKKTWIIISISILNIFLISYIFSIVYFRANSTISLTDGDINYTKTDIVNQLTPSDYNNIQLLKKYIEKSDDSKIKKLKDKLFDHAIIGTSYNCKMFEDLFPNEKQINTIKQLKTNKLEEEKPFKDTFFSIALLKVKKYTHIPIKHQDKLYFVPIIDGFNFLKISNFSCENVKSESKTLIKCTVALYCHNSTNIEMVLLPPLESTSLTNTGQYPSYGEFTMGSSLDEIFPTKNVKLDDIDSMYAKEIPKHSVKLTPFLISRYETTQGQWDMFKTECKLNDDRKWKNAHLPIYNVSWYDVVKFCNFVGLDLPTEAQWEFSCRAGTTTKFCYGDITDDKQFNFNGNPPYNKKYDHLQLTMPTYIGNYNSNAFGLFDMHGNVMEWVKDTWDVKFYGSEQALSVNPVSPTDLTNYAVRRGGSYI